MCVLLMAERHLCSFSIFTAEIVPMSLSLLHHLVSLLRCLQLLASSHVIDWPTRTQMSASVGEECVVFKTIPIPQTAKMGQR